MRIEDIRNSYIIYMPAYAFALFCFCCLTTIKDDTEERNAQKIISSRNFVQYWEWIGGDFEQQRILR